MFKSKPRKKRPADGKGFTLLETMIALFVFTFGMLALLKLQMVSINSNTAAQAVSESTNLAVSDVEGFNAINWNAPESQSASEVCDPPLGDPPDEDGFWTCIAISEGPGPGITAIADDKDKAAVRLIMVTKSFVDKGGTRRSTTLTLLKPRI